jgi:hypothetical protein
VVFFEFFMSSDDQYLCPIGKQRMIDPVIDKEGNSYERSNIVRWLETHGTSPITRTPMSINDLIPNRSLRDVIESLTSTEPQTSTNSETITESLGPEPEISTFSESIPGDSQRILLQFSCPDQEYRSPIAVCCVIDTSYSMSTEATLGSNGGSENCGLCILDIVKHSVHTVIKSLQSGDQLSIVIFSASAVVVLPLTNMDSVGQAMAVSTLNSLKPDANTNLYAGLEAGLDVMKGYTGHGLTSLMLFTDGEPNIIPPRGHIPTLERYQEKCGGTLPARISTFGFGYSLDSKLLNELAIFGNGQYAFIPDSGFTGTIFVHAVANLKTLAVRKCVLSVEVEDCSISSLKIYGHKVTQGGNNFVDVDINTIYYGQPKFVVIDIPQAASCFFRVRGLRGPNVLWNKTFEISPNPSAEIETQFFRLMLVEKLHEAIAKAQNGLFDESQHIMQDFLNQIPSSMAGLIQDVQGQVKEAFIPAYFGKWGRHYLPSLLFAHLDQTCNNFKDPGVQSYGGRMFRKYRDEADDLFLKLPPPTPCMPQRAAQLSSSTAPISMATWNNPNNVCFQGTCNILLADGSLKNVQDLRRGDLVSCPNGKSAAVQCIIESTAENPMLISYGKLLITPWHPIREENTWKFPIEVGEPVISKVTSLYSIMLDCEHIVYVEGIECVCLGHSFSDDIVSHPFFGSDKVKMELKALCGWSDGFVRISGVIRDQKTGIITGFHQNEN